MPNPSYGKLRVEICGDSTMRAKRFFLVISCFAFLTNIGIVLGDGKVFLQHIRDADILQPAQKAYIKWNGSEEKLVLQTKYEGPAEEMVWIIPVPSEPKVEKGDPNLFEQLSDETRHSGLSYTDFFRLRALFAIAPLAANLGQPDVVEWRERIGDYDVVLLRPVGEEDVIQWLNSNQFGVPDEAVPILRDYINERWWMVAAKIHRDALTDITQEKLAKGLLHPLELTFKSTKCIYPLRLTSLVSGPVEELIYIEGPTHYEPVTLRSDNWNIKFYGGPSRAPETFSWSDVEVAIKFAEGRTKTSFNRYLTKLRRVFKPEEMTDDIIFDKADYPKLFESGNHMKIGQAATWYGRHRDPNGVQHLLKALSPEFLDEFRPAKEDYSQRFAPSAKVLTGDGYKKQKYCDHLRSCIWALGEIAIDHNGVKPAIEQTLLLCAKHENQKIRMEAYIALIKLGSKKVGPIMLNRFTQVFSGDISLNAPYWTIEKEDNILLAEMIIIADWIELLGSIQQKSAFIEVLSKTIQRLPVDLDEKITWFWNESERENIYPFYLSPWLVWRAAHTQDPRLVKPLENYRAKYPDTSRKKIHFILRAEAACAPEKQSDFK